MWLDYLTSWWELPCRNCKALSVARGWQDVTNACLEILWQASEDVAAIGELVDRMFCPWKPCWLEPLWLQQIWWLRSHTICISEPAFAWEQGSRLQKFMFSLQSLQCVCRLTQTSRQLRSELPVLGRQMTLAPSRDSNGVSSELLFFMTSEGQASLYAASYDRLASWIDNSLDAYKVGCLFLMDSNVWQF